MREGGGEGEGDPHRRDAADPAEVGGGVCGGAREESREGGVESRWGGVARGIDNAGRGGVSIFYRRVHFRTGQKAKVASLIIKSNN